MNYLLTISANESSVLIWCLSIGIVALLVCATIIATKMNKNKK